ncbi:MAG: hypothetical protein ABSA11_09850 [Candidatus Bathyarchaeia archaeon]|jgi:hypothetical protein
MFKDLLGGIKKEAEKRMAQQEDVKKQEEQKRNEASKPQPQRNRRNGKYGRLAAWIKSNYGTNFKDGQTSDEVKAQLDKIFSELDSKGSLSGDAKRGFRTFIDTRKYGDLVKVRE